MRQTIPNRSKACAYQLAMILVLIIPHTGCYTTFTYDFDPKRTERIENSGIIRSWSNSVEVVTKPTVDNPRLVLNVLKTPLVRYETQQWLPERRRPSYFATFVALFGGIGGALAFLQGVTTGNAGVAIPGAAGVGWGIWWLVQDWSAFSGKEVAGSKGFVYANGPPVAVTHALFKASVGGAAVQCTADGVGYAQIDVVKELTLRRVNSSDPIVVEVSFADGEVQKISLDPRSWMVPHARIIKNKVSVVTEESGKLRQLGTAKIGSEYRILHESTGLLKIDFSPQAGYIQADASEKFWAIPLYLDQK